MTFCLWTPRKLERVLGEQALTGVQLVFKIEDLACGTECVDHRRGFREELVASQTGDNIMMRLSDASGCHLYLTCRRIRR